MELVSIIVPIYKCEDYLDECVASICNQTYKNLEIILVDDGSPDSCGEKCDQWRNKDNRITVIHKKNEGLSAARNDGIEASHGQYLCFVDSDDYISPNLVSCLYHTLKEKNVKMAMGTYFLEVDGVIKDTEISMPDTVMKWDQLLKKMQDGGVHLYEIGTVFWSKLFHRSIFSDLRFPVGKKYEDIWLMHKVLFEAEEIAFVNMPLYYYRIRKGSISHSAFTAERFEEIYARIDKYRFLREKSDDHNLLGDVANGTMSKAVEDYCYVRRDSGHGAMVELNKFTTCIREFYFETKKDGIRFNRGFTYQLFITVPVLFYLKVKMKKIVVDLVRK